MELTHREPTTSYRHTQVGVLPIILCVAVTAFCVALAVRSHLMVLWAAAALFVVVGLGMSYLTVRVTADAVLVVFGPGVFRRRIPIPEIASAEAASTFAAEGWGIRITMEGMLYNITGDQAVRIHLRSGKKIRIGTDDTAGLVAAITARVAHAQ